LAIHSNAWWVGIAEVIRIVRDPLGKPVAIPEAEITVIQRLIEWDA